MRRLCCTSRAAESNCKAAVPPCLAHALLLAHAPEGRRPGVFAEVVNLSACFGIASAYLVFVASTLISIEVCHAHCTASRPAHALTSLGLRERGSPQTWCCSNAQIAPVLALCDCPSACLPYLAPASPPAAGARRRGGGGLDAGTLYGRVSVRAGYGQCEHHCHRRRLLRRHRPHLHHGLLRPARARSPVMNASCCSFQTALRLASLGCFCADRAAHRNAG